jgi:hypothetical protein
MGTFYIEVMIVEILHDVVSDCRAVEAHGTDPLLNNESRQKRSDRTASIDCDDGGASTGHGQP